MRVLPVPVAWSTSSRLIGLSGCSRNAADSWCNRILRPAKGLFELPKAALARQFEAYLAKASSPGFGPQLDQTWGICKAPTGSQSNSSSPLSSSGASSSEKSDTSSSPSSSSASNCKSSSSSSSASLLTLPVPLTGIFWTFSIFCLGALATPFVDFENLEENEVSTLEVPTTVLLGAELLTEIARRCGPSVLSFDGQCRFGSVSLVFPRRRRLTTSIVLRCTSSSSSKSWGIPPTKTFWTCVGRACNRAQYASSTWPKASPFAFLESVNKKQLCLLIRCVSNTGFQSAAVLASLIFTMAKRRHTKLQQPLQGGHWKVSPIPGTLKVALVYPLALSLQCHLQ